MNKSSGKTSVKSDSGPTEIILILVLILILILTLILILILILIVMLILILILIIERQKTTKGTTDTKPNLRPASRIF